MAVLIPSIDVRMSKVMPKRAPSLHAQLRSLIASSRQRLAQEFGRGFMDKNLRRMVQFAEVFAQPEIVVTLSRQLSSSHTLAMLSSPKILPRAT